MKKFILLLFITVFSSFVIETKAATDSPSTVVSDALADPEAFGASDVPEPSTYALLGMGIVAIMMVLCRKTNQA